MRQNIKRYFFVYFLPFVLFILISILSYFLNEYFNFKAEDKYVGYFVAFGVGYLFYIRNRFKWMRISDSSLIYIDKITNLEDNFVKASEPSVYIVAFYKSLISKIVTVFCGLVLIGIGIYLFFNSGITFPILIIIFGIFINYIGVKELFDNLPVLKLTISGIWTKKLGFKPWYSIKKTEIKVEKSLRSSQTYLEIYLKNNEYGYPEERLLLNDLENFEKIKPLIDELIKG